MDFGTFITSFIGWVGKIWGLFTPDNPIGIMAWLVVIGFFVSIVVGIIRR